MVQGMGLRADNLKVHCWLLLGMASMDPEAREKGIKVSFLQETGKKFSF